MTDSATQAAGPHPDQTVYATGLPPVDVLPSTDDQRDAPPPAGHAGDPVMSLTQRAYEKLQQGDDAAAEEILLEAIRAAELRLGRDHPEVGLLLNEVARIQLKQRRFDVAEPTLLRLLELKRTKGHDHPEVATVLASVAGVHRALGRHDSAEQLWRQVLAIRERNLAPNHFSTASAVEHLAEECEARGNLTEAVTLFQRAMTMRASLVGSNHPSIQSTREHIADLQLRAAEDGPLPGTSLVPVSTPYSRYAEIPRDPLPRLDSTIDSSRGYRTGRTIGVDPWETRDFPFDRSGPGSPARNPLPSGVETSEPPAVDYSKLLDGDGDDELEADEKWAGAISRFVQAVSARISGRIAAVAGTLVIVLVALLLVIPAVNRSRAAALNETPTELVSRAEAQIPTPPSVTRPGTLTPTPSSLNSTSSKPVDPPPARSRTQETKSAKKTSSESAQTPINLPAMALKTFAGVDSVAAKVGSANSREVDTDVPVKPPTLPVRPRVNFRDESTAGPERARLIGELPTPKVPPQVADVDGEVRVRFNVDTLGRPMLETFSVVSSPNPLLTAAVRRVIPGMRFEPAKTGGPEPKPVGDVVQIGFQFARSR